ncbi:Uncharacterised protein [Mycobacteroides abscessus subsp. abscessus]|nr:Uncharacterised protein [Mycobacteroides abscessus subsp. abscessus]
MRAANETADFSRRSSVGNVEADTSAPGTAPAPVVSGLRSMPGAVGGPAFFGAESLWQAGAVRPTAASRAAAATRRSRRDFIPTSQRWRHRSPARGAGDSVPGRRSAPVR